MTLHKCKCAFSLSSPYASAVFTFLQVAQQMLLEDAPLSLQQMHAKLLHGLFNVSATPAGLLVYLVQPWQLSTGAIPG